jgi:hypothetical protein
MSASSVIDVALGVALVLLVVSTGASVALETARNAFNMRKRTLFREIGEILDGNPEPRSDSTTRKFYDSRPIRNLMSRHERELMDADRRFRGVWMRKAAVQRAKYAGPGWIDQKSFVDGALAADPERVACLTGSKEPAAQREDLEHLFQVSMNRLTGDYRKGSRAWLFGVGLLAAVVFQVNLIDITHALWRDQSTRATVVDLAEQCEGDTDCAADLRDDLQSIVGLPIGWTCESTDDEGVVTEEGCPVWQGLTELDGGGVFFGFALTAAGVSVGAPFWYDAVRALLRTRRERDSDT